MKKLFLLTILVVFAVLVPTSYVSSESSREIIYLQRGIIVQITHTCTGRALLYQVGVNFSPPAEIKGVTPMNFELEPTLEADRWITLTLQSLNENDRVVGVYTLTFSLQQWNTTIVRSWSVGNSYGRGGGGNGQQFTRCNY